MQNHQAEFIAGAAELARLPPIRLPQVAFAGRSNVGKSSLINRLVGRRSLARVSKTPGRTQQINFFLIDGALIFTDLPGYGFARVPLAVKDQWKELVEGYLTSEIRPRCAVVIVDVRRGVQDEDAVLLRFLGTVGISGLLVATKLDKLKRSERREAEASVRRGLGAAQKLFLCSAETGEGVPELWAELRRRCEE